MALDIKFPVITKTVGVAQMLQAPEPKPAVVATKPSVSPLTGKPVQLANPLGLRSPALAATHAVLNNAKQEVPRSLGLSPAHAAPYGINQTPIVNQSNGAQQIASPASPANLANAIICERLDQLQLDLMQGNPGIGEGLRVIHRNMLDDPSQVTLLSVEQRACFFKGLMKHTATVITTAASKTRQSSKKEFGNMTVDDLL